MLLCEAVGFLSQAVSAALMLWSPTMCLGRDSRRSLRASFPPLSCCSLAMRELTGTNADGLQSRHACVQINEHLQTRVYMVGDEVTLADLVLLGAVQEAVVSNSCRLCLHTGTASVLWLLGAKGETVYS